MLHQAPESYSFQQSGPQHPGGWYRGSRGQNGGGYRPWQGGGGRGPWNYGHNQNNYQERPPSVQQQMMERMDKMLNLMAPQESNPNNNTNTSSTNDSKTNG